MSKQQKPNSGALFANDRRRGDKDPTHTGSATIDDKEYWLSAWVNESQAGKRYFSIKFRPKESNGVQTADPAPAKDAFNDDIPF